MLSAHTLKAQRREKLGSRYAQRERARGMLPGVVYGHGQDPVAITLNAKETLRYLHQGEKVFTIEMAGESSGQTVILKDLQFDYLGTNVVHVDLARVDLDEEIEANVPIRLVGEAIGMKKANAILTFPNKELKVRCTVRTLPDHVDLNISTLDMGHALHCREIPLPQGVKLAEDPDAIVVSITMVKEEVAAEAATADGAPAQPEVITAKKEEPKDEGGDKGKKEKK
ncbi:MAG: 50S ribosomal protein L25 [Planctomycetota bacterium]|nr:50S ribosomal protein L25 [Planctomycetota bacterium]